MEYNIEDNFIEQLKNQYYEIYISILILGGKNFERLIIILNIFIELNTIPNKVKDKMTGFIRLMWWRETFEGLANGKIKNHPLIDNFTDASEQELSNLNKIIEVIELEFEDQDNSKIYIKDKYNSLFNLIIAGSDTPNQIPENFLYSFFIVVEILVNKKIDYLKKIDFFATNDTKNDLEYTRKLIDKSVEYLDIFYKNSLYKNNLFLYLISNALIYYTRKFNKINYDIYLFSKIRYRLGLTIYLYIKSIKFKLMKFLIRNIK